jgi:hypothetical protein
MSIMKEILSEDVPVDVVAIISFTRLLRLAHHPVQQQLHRTNVRINSIRCRHRYTV